VSWKCTEQSGVCLRPVSRAGIHSQVADRLLARACCVTGVGRHLQDRYLSNPAIRTCVFALLVCGLCCDTQLCR